MKQSGSGYKILKKFNSGSRPLPKIKKLISDVDGYLSLREAGLLYLLARYGPCKGAVVEIGTYKGRATMCLAQGVKDRGEGKVFTIDPFKDFWTSNPDNPRLLFKAGLAKREFLENIRKVSLKKYIKLFTATSKKASRGWRMPIRLLWIDGRHEYKYVKKDFKCWEPFVSRGGIIAFHDIRFEGPKTVIFENISDTGRFKDIVVVDDILIVSKR
jgi:predicted O-methyltransferase YrrM